MGGVISKEKEETMLLSSAPLNGVEEAETAIE